MSRKQKRMQDIREAKDKKMKKVAIGLSVVLVAVLAFEVPKVLHSGGPSSAPVSDSTTTAAPTTGTPTATPTATPTSTPAGTAAAAVLPTATAAPAKLTNSDQSPKAGKSQLVSFSHFASKDPFSQQIEVAPQGQPAAAGQAASGSPTTAQAPTSAGTTAAVTHNRPTRTLAVTGAARISVNGRVQVVRVGAKFPSANPLFRLLSVHNGVAKIAIANGSYSSGAKAIPLAPGRSLTLVDTADGIRYQIRLVA